MVLGYKEGTIPKEWRYLDFAVFMQIAQVFKIKPLGANDSPVYSRPGEIDAEKRDFVNWKKLFTYFVLLRSEVPSSNALALY